MSIYPSLEDMVVHQMMTVQSTPSATPGGFTAIPAAPMINPAAPMSNPVAPMINPAAFAAAPMRNPVAPMSNPVAPMINPAAPMINPAAPMINPAAIPTSPMSNASPWMNPSSQPSRPDTGAGGFLYPGLGPYMGLEFTESEIRNNMPQYLPQPPKNSEETSNALVPSSSSAVQLPFNHGGTQNGVIAPLSANNFRQLSHGVRQIILCKDGKGKVGLRVKSIDKGIFVCLVTASSPAALGGLRFGDQILQINGENVAGFSASKVHDIFKKAGVNNIVLAVRDRPFERCLTLHKDSTGHLGFQFRDGKITSIAINSSAARNGLLIEHNLLEVDGQNVVGMKDKDVRKIIDEGGLTVNVTVIPNYIFRHMMKNMSDSIVQKLMDHSTQEL